MVRLLLILLLGFNFYVSTEQTLKPVDENSQVKFRIKNLGIGTTGSFKGLEGNIRFDAANPGAGHFDVSIDASSINTGIGARDNHLRKAEYFDVKNHSRIKFVSDKITSSTREGTWIVFGKLTIKNTTKEISFPFTAVRENGGMRFSGEFKLNRRDYGVGGSSFSLSDNLTVYLNVFAKNSE
jgi:polyisoprenoid-binding protein YceI